MSLLSKRDNRCEERQHAEPPQKINIVSSAKNKAMFLFSYGQEWCILVFTNTFDSGHMCNRRYGDEAKVYCVMYIVVKNFSLIWSRLMCSRI